MPRTRTISWALAACGLLAGCFGDGGSGTPLAPTNESPGGIWNGTDSQGGITRAVFGIVTESGQFHFIRSDGTQYVGTVTTKGTSGSGSFDGYAPIGRTFQDGSTHGTGTVAGTVYERSSLSATTQFTTDKGAAYGDSMSLAFDSLYNQPSSLATIAGNYTEAGTGTVFSVDGAGVVFAQEGVTIGCVINGQVSIIDASYNAYAVSLSYASCVGEYAVLNGLTLSGLGTLDTTALQPRAIIGLHGGSGASRVALVATLNRI